jgi:hypothetical protein
MRKDILAQLQSLEQESPYDSLKKIKALLLSDGSSNIALAEQLLIAEDYSPLQSLVIKNLVLNKWTIGKRIVDPGLDDQIATLSGLTYFSKTKAIIEAEANSNPISAHIQSKWGACDFHQTGHNRWDEVYGILNNQYIGFVALLDGIPFLVTNDFIEVNHGDGPYNSFLSNINICILTTLPETLQACSPLTVKLQLVYEESALCPQWISLEGKFESEESIEFECLIEAMDEAGWGMNLGIRREANKLAFEELFDIEIPREEADITTKTPIQINKEILLKITKHQNFADFTAHAAAFRKTKLSSGNAVTDFLYQLLG